MARRLSFDNFNAFSRSLRSHVDKTACSRVIERGFTLAEVLITLAIIGVVAALTIPTVVRNYQKQQMVSGVKKAYSALSQAMNMAIMEYGPTSAWSFPSGEYGISPFMNAYFLPHLKITRICGKNMYTGNCEVKYRYMNSNSWNPSDNYTTRYFMADGSILLAYARDLGTRVRLFYDINGKNGPNIIGRDIFAFFVEKGKNKIVVYDNNGRNRTNMYYCGNKVLDDVAGGVACTGEILNKGKVDYEW